MLVLIDDQNKLELITGVPPQNQRLTLHNGEDDTEAVAVLDEDVRPIGYYSIRDWQVLKVRALTTPYRRVAL